MTLEWFEASYSVWRLPAGNPGPVDAFCVMRTPDETTVVTRTGSPPPGIPSSGPWRLFRIADQLPHDAVGIMAALSAVLAQAGIPILPFGSFDTDYVLVPQDAADRARSALTRAGYTHQ